MTTFFFFLRCRLTCMMRPTPYYELGNERLSLATKENELWILAFEFPKLSRGGEGKKSLIYLMWIFQSLSNAGLILAVLGIFVSLYDTDCVEDWFLLDSSHSISPCYINCHEAQLSCTSLALHHMFHLHLDLHIYTAIHFLQRSLVFISFVVCTFSCFIMSDPPHVSHPFISKHIAR